ncbi:MAG: hypothetical protein DYG94_05955 [Leptolyngbya sp. PLA3]|nr:MAG: hypothetical protein EDM82_03615 [Cyanobacteria bacterium CYA]MCE7968272.1 hypothetical protein [Leptolyngbya sp. PL-A3]
MTRIRRCISALFVSVSVSAALAQDMVQPEELEQGFVIVVDDIARVATKERPMYLASNFGGWDPANHDYLMTPRSDGRWQIVFEHPRPDATLQFKFTLGSWDFVETDPDGNDIDNRTLPKVDRAALAGERPVFELRVPKFRNPSDIANERDSTEYRDWQVTGSLRRLQVSGGAGPAQGAMRDLLVWLPPEYDDASNADRRYPVLYLFDGQNLFASRKGGPKEWGVDETATRLIAAGEVEPLIVVGIPHAGAGRMSEYQPFDMGLRAEPGGQAFAQWFMGELKPRVERAFRVSPHREHTGIGGASLGGTIALYIAGENPEAFGLLLLESTAPLDRADNAEARDWLDDVRHWPIRTFVGVGGREFGEGEQAASRGKAFVEWSRGFSDHLSSTGEPGSVRFRLEPEAAHNEEAWAGRLPEALRFLYPARDE